MQSTDADSCFTRMVSLRRALHRYPELAYEEVKTAQIVMDELDRLGIPFEYQGKGGGVVGRLEGKNPGVPTVGLRAELDALPTFEDTGLPFSSEHEGRMHACGHDVHMAMVLGAAARLKALPPSGSVLFIFQPGEEVGGGSRVVLNSGLLDDVQAIYAGHVTHHYSVGEIMVVDGVITAHADMFKIKVKGKGGHGARPHEAIDAVVITGLLISAIQTLVSREIDPMHPSVVTVGKVVAGTAANVIAEEAVLEGTIRTTLPEVRDHIHRGLIRIGNAMGALHNARIDVEIDPGYPPVVNTERETEIAAEAARKIVGPSGLVPMEYPSMGAEDFSYMLQKIPGCYVRFGARKAEDAYIPLHSPRFDVNEEVMKVGAAFFEEVVRESMDTLGE